MRKAGRKRPYGRSSCRWKDTIRMDLKETAWKVVDWVHLDNTGINVAVL
jgi:hypothetical protein